MLQYISQTNGLQLESKQKEGPHGKIPFTCPVSPKYLNEGLS